MHSHSTRSGARISLLSGLAFALVLGVASSRAEALTLADVDCVTNAACQSFMASSAPLTFSDFEVYISGDLDTDLSAYDIEVLSDGFRLTGPLDADAGEFGDLVLTYVVSADPGASISVATLAFDAVASGNGALASVAEDLFGGGGPKNAVGDLFVAVTGGGLSILTDQASVEPPIDRLRVLKDIVVVGGPDGSAAIRSVDQRFPGDNVPAPGAAALLGIGIAGLWSFGSRKRD